MLKEHKALKVEWDLRDTKDLKVGLVHRAHRVRQEPALKEHRVLRVHRVLKEHKELKVKLVQVHRVHKAPREKQEL